MIIIGVVKKVGALKIIHERYKPKKANDVENNAFKETFNNAVELDPSLKFQIGKAQEDLNPLIVYNLFCKITSEVIWVNIINVINYDC